MNELIRLNSICTRNIMFMNEGYSLNNDDISEMEASLENIKKLTILKNGGNKKY